MNENPTPDNKEAAPTPAARAEQQAEVSATSAQAALTEDESRLLQEIPADGSNVGNISLRRDLGWNDQRYWDVRRGLLDKGLISLSRGRGGGVRRVTEQKSVAVEPTGVQGDASAGQVAAEVSKSKESDYYKPTAQTLREQWAPDLGYENFDVEVIAWQGRRPTGGAWTRPDIVLINVANYRYVPGRYLDVITFELKVAEDTDVKAVYEALAHRRAGTRAYLIIVGGGPIDDEELEELIKEAGRHGVGIIEAVDCNRVDTWKFHVEPQRADADPSDLDEFIDTQLSSELKRKISLWVK
jgi:hypothetical protein